MLVTRRARARGSNFNCADGGMCIYIYEGIYSVCVRDFCLGRLGARERACDGIVTVL